MEYCGTTAEVVGYIAREYGVEPEFLWARTPNNAAFRHRGTKKWFGAILMDLPGKNLGRPDIHRVDILDLKCDPLMIGSLIDGRGYLPGYHMNKEHWVTVLLNGSVPLEEIFSLIDLSYALTSPKRKGGRPE